jgi:hypothetical protein
MSASQTVRREIDELKESMKTELRAKLDDMLSRDDPRAAGHFAKETLEMVRRNLDRFIDAAGVELLDRWEAHSRQRAREIAIAAIDAMLKI